MQSNVSISTLKDIVVRTEWKILLNALFLLEVEYVYNYREILNFIASGLIVIATDALLIIIDNSVSDCLFQLTFLDRYLVEANLIFRS